MKVTLKDGLEVDVALPRPAQRPAVFVFGMHKCGSTLLNRIVRTLCAYSSVPAVQLPSLFFSQGLNDSAWVDQESMVNLIQDGYCYCGFRYYPIFFDHCGLVWNRKSLLMVRDPRDAITSMYYSVAYSHVTPDEEKAKQEFVDKREAVQQTDIDEFCLEYAQTWIYQWERLMNTLVKNEHCKIYRYEDIIFDKRKLVDGIIEHLDLTVDEIRRKEVAKLYDIIPKKEDKSKHIRFVKPGNHRDRLKPETIAKINEQFAHVLEHFEYEP